MKVIYPVLFYEEENGSYSVFVPDLENNSTCGKDLEEAIYMAQDLIAGCILTKLEEGFKIPKASKIESVSFNALEKYLNIEDWNYKNRFKNYVMVDVDEFAKKWDNKLIKKTVNIPQWVNTKAEEMHINFSKALEEALIKQIYEE